MSIFLLESKIRIKNLLIFCTIISMLLFGTSFLLSIMQDMVALIEGKLDAFPAEMLEALHVTDFMMFTHPFGVFSYIYQYTYIAICAYFAYIGSSILVKEENDKTIEFLYSKPFTRSEIFLNKLLSGIFYLVVFNFIVDSFALMGILIQDSTVDIVIFIKSALIMVIPQLVIYLLSILISLFIKNPKNGVIISISCVFGFYILGILSKLHDNLEFLKYFSLIDYFNMTDLLYNGKSIELVFLVIFIVLSLFSVVASYFNYLKRDFNC